MAGQGQPISLPGDWLLTLPADYDLYQSDQGYYITSSQANLILATLKPSPLGGWAVTLWGRDLACTLLDKQLILTEN